MKKNPARIGLLFAALLLLCISSIAQTSISNLPLYSGNPAGGWVPIVISNTTRKVDAASFALGKVDSVKYHLDSLATASLLALKVGTAKYATDSAATATALALKLKYTDTAAMLSTYARTIAVPTNNNQLTNGAGYITSPVYYDSLLMASTKRLKDSAAAIRGAIAAGGLTVDATPTPSSTNPVQSGGTFNALALKVNISDTAAILGKYTRLNKEQADSGTLAGRINTNTSNISVNTAAIGAKQDTATAKTYYSATNFYGDGSSGNPIKILGKQDSLQSGTNIKTINSTSILGSGNIVITGTGGGSSDSLRQLSTNPGTGNVYLSTADNRVHYKSGGYWYRVAIIDSAAATNTAPTASAVTLIGVDTVGKTRSLTYTYYDADGDAEGASVKKWYTYTSNAGAGQTLVATAATYTIARADTGKYIRGSITPYALTGISPGTETFTGYSGVIKDSAVAGGGTAVNVTSWPFLNSFTLATNSLTSTANGATAASSKRIVSGTNGAVRMTCDLVGNTSGTLCLSRTSAAQALSSIDHATLVYNGVIYICPGGAYTSTGVAAAQGNILQWRIAGSSLYLEKSTDGGTTFTTVGTYTPAAGDLYVKAVGDSGYKLSNIQGINLQ